VRFVLSVFRTYSGETQDEMGSLTSHLSHPKKQWVVSAGHTCSPFSSYVDTHWLLEVMQGVLPEQLHEQCTVPSGQVALLLPPLVLDCSAKHVRPAICWQGRERPQVHVSSAVDAVGAGVGTLEPDDAEQCTVLAGHTCSPYNSCVP